MGKKTKPKFVSILELRSQFYNQLMDNIAPMNLDSETEKVSSIPCNLDEKTRWEMLKMINKKLVNARGNNVADVRVL